MSEQKQSGKSTQQKQLRLWPGVIAAILLLLLRFGVIRIFPESVIIGVFGGLLCALVIIIWWIFFSRASRSERWSAVALIIIALAVTWLLLDKSMRFAPFFAYTIPVLCLAFVFWAVACRRFSVRSRRIALVVVLTLACGVWTLIRTGGITADFQSDFTWRWAETPEEQLLAQSDDEPMVIPPNFTLPQTKPEWPGFRGPNRDGIVPNIQIDTDWSASPPVELWRRPIGPGWSSFAVHGEVFFTQEQRGDYEAVTCYSITTGKPIWRHLDETRFWESNGGAGPRGTPTIYDGHIYTLGGTGIVNVLEAIDGSLVWSRNAATDTNTKVPMWGFSGSPLIVDDVVVVAVAGSLVAYDLNSGEPRWSNQAGGDCYSSPHLIDINGIRQIMLQNDFGIISVSPTDGTSFWEHPWKGHPIVQPAITEDGDILVSADERSGIRRIKVTHELNEWTVEELWTSDKLKPYFNDSVIHEGHVYGFDGRSLACIDIEDGTRKWKGGRYGRGQFILLADQDLLLVISEKGELALVKAVSDQFTELAKLPAIEGKTWNHPVLVGNILLVRNAQEMAAFQLSLSGD